MKKIILFILLGFLVANAQPGQSRYQGRTGYQQSIIWNDLHKSLQDSIRNIIADSANANIINFLEDSLSASNGIVYSSRNFSQDTVNTVASLQSLSAVFGTTVFLREVATGGYGAGEMICVDSTDLKTMLGTAVPDGGVIFTAPGADNVWVRREYYETRSFISPDWYGAKSDGSTNDSSAIQKAINLANDYGGFVQLGEGNYSFNGPIYLNPRDENDGLIFKGVGVDKTFLTPLGNTDAISINKSGIGVPAGQSYSAHVKISDLTITGPGKATSTGKGIELDSTGFCKIYNVKITGFEYGIYAQQPNTNVVEHCYITSNKWGIYFTANVNGNRFVSNIISQSDSAGITIVGGGSNTINGGESGRNRVYYRGRSASDVQLDGVNMEADSHLEFDLDNSSVLFAKNFTSVKDPSTGPNLKLAQLTQSSALHLDNPILSAYDMTIDSNHVWIEGNSNFVTAKNMSALNVVRVYNAQTSSHYYALPYITYPYNQGITADSTHRGQLYMTIQRGSNASPVTTEEDYIQYKRRTWTGAYVTSRVGVEDRYFSATGASHAYAVGLANFVGYKGFNLGGGVTDSVDVTITVDSLITVYSAVATVYDDLTGGVQIPCFVTHLSGVANTTTIVFRVWYKWNVGAANTGLRLHYNIWGKKYYE